MTACDRIKGNVLARSPFVSYQGAKFRPVDGGYGLGLGIGAGIIRIDLFNIR
jgi:hypothetical protein